MAYHDSDFPQRHDSAKAAPAGTSARSCSTQHFRIEAEYDFDTATALISDLIAQGLSVDAKQEGKRWIITGDLQDTSNRRDDEGGDSRL